MTEITGITRLAPSPTGAMHLGNVRTFVINYALAVQNGWRVLMRIEDLETPRVKKGADTQLLKELTWLGLDWAQPVEYQSARDKIYKNYLQRLIDSGHAYPCICSRKDIELANSAPHHEDQTGVYPQTCRDKFKDAHHAHKHSGRVPAWRVRVNDRPIVVEDNFMGRCEFDLSRYGGDFVIYRNYKAAAYQLAVVVDDATAGVDCIVRADDLIDSAARQIYLRDLLGLDNKVRYWHLPLVQGPDGKRLAKRHGDTRLCHYHQLGATPQRVLGLVAFWSGVLAKRDEISMEDFVQRFDIKKLIPDPVVFSKADDEFLKS